MDKTAGLLKAFSQNASRPGKLVYSNMSLPRELL
jgi:hypothetical protein